MDLFVQVQSGVYSATRSWYFEQEGSLSLHDPLSRNYPTPGLFADGRAVITLMEGNSMINYEFEVCQRGRLACGPCVEGLLEFDSFPVITVDYDPAVPNQENTWGCVKATYR